MALDLHPIVWYNYVMEMKKSMTFAAGWVQEIDTSDESRERAIEAHRQAEMAAHHLAVSKAMKPASLTFKPFANLKELLV